jgi:predicted GIY-YIG superfamily endonuclease
MYSLVNLDNYKKKHWGGYVLECATDKAIYIGMSANLDNRMREHLSGNKQASGFVRRYGGPVRVLELYFCNTEEQARQWERDTSDQLYTTYKDRPVYHLGYRSINSPTAHGPKRFKQVPLISKQSMDAYKHLFKMGTKHRSKQPY